MNSFFNFFKVFNNNSINKSDKFEDSDLIKYFKSEYGPSWRLELDKYIIKNDVDDKAA